MLDLIETHTHLFMPPLADDVAGVLARARTAGVNRCIVPAYDLASWPGVAALAAEPGVHTAFGLHPWVADEMLDTGRLERQLRECRAVAVGEIGLDFKVDSPAPAVQLAVLERQLRLAVDLDLPVILHCRGAFEPMLDALRPFAPRLRGVLHAYSRGLELARRFVAAGLHIAFGGAVTRPGARRARRSAQDLPLEQIVLETDSPAIGLDGVPAEAAEPRHVRQVAEALAELRGETLPEIAAATTANASALFALD